MRENREYRGIFAAAAKCYCTELGNQFYFLRENRDSHTIIAAVVKSDNYQL